MAGRPNLSPFSTFSTNLGHFILNYIIYIFLFYVYFYIHFGQIPSGAYSRTGGSRRSAFADYLAGEQKTLKDFEGLSLIRDKFLRQFYA